MLRFVPFLVLALAIVGTPVRTANRTDSWRWQMAFVDPTREHLELRYGSGDDRDWDDGILVARVGRPVNRVFPVHFVLPDDDRDDAEAREAVRRSLDYYLVELGKPDPWDTPFITRRHWPTCTRGCTGAGSVEGSNLDVLRARSSVSTLWARKVQTSLLASDRRAAFACDRERRLVSQTFASWNQIAEWLRRLHALTDAA